MVEHGGHQPSIRDLLFPAINFAIFAVLLYRFLAAPVREYFRERTERLRNALEAGRRAHEQALALQAQLARDIQELPAVQARLKADLMATADEARSTLLEQGRIAAERIRGDAVLVAEQEGRAAQRAVRAEIVEESVRQATALVQQAITQADQSRFVQEFVTAAEPTS